MGSRARTAVLNLRCPVVAYGLPLGLRAWSAWSRHRGQRPVPWCSSGHVGLVQTRQGLGMHTLFVEPPSRLEHVLEVGGCNQRWVHAEEVDAAC